MPVYYLACSNDNTLKEGTLLHARGVHMGRSPASWHPLHGHVALFTISLPFLGCHYTPTIFARLQRRIWNCCRPTHTRTTTEASRCIRLDRFSSIQPSKLPQPIEQTISVLCISISWSKYTTYLWKKLQKSLINPRKSSSLDSFYSCLLVLIVLHAKPKK